MATRTTVSISLTPDEKERVQTIKKVTKIPFSTLGKEALLALCDYIEAEGLMTMPLLFVPAHSETGKAYLAELAEKKASETPKARQTA